MTIRQKCTGTMKRSGTARILILIFYKIEFKPPIKRHREHSVTQAPDPKSLRRTFCSARLLFTVDAQGLSNHRGEADAVAAAATNRTVQSRALPDRPQPASGKRVTSTQKWKTHEPCGMGFLGTLSLHGHSSKPATAEVTEEAGP